MAEISSVPTGSDSAPDRMLLIVARFGLALLFLYSGFGKVVGFADFAQYLAGRGVPVPILLTIGAIIVELGAGASLAIGYRVRWAAWILAAYTIAATIIGHPFWQGGADADANLVHALKNMAIVGGLLAANVAQSAFRARRP